MVELEAGMAIMVGSETEIYGPGGVPNEDETPNPDGEGQLDEE